jgi:hypothetical protein
MQYINYILLLSNKLNLILHRKTVLPEKACVIVSLTFRQTWKGKKGQVLFPDLLDKLYVLFNQVILCT